MDIPRKLYDTRWYFTQKKLLMAGEPCERLSPNELCFSGPSPKYWGAPRVHESWRINNKNWAPTDSQKDMNIGSSLNSLTFYILASVVI